jgi:hypothetical protein
VHTLTIYEKILIGLFLVSLPLANPWVRGDGVGYYAFARAILIEHSLDFRADWLHANTSFRMGRLDDTGTIDTAQYTSTGHLDNHFSIGPAILWAPFLIAAHAGVLTADTLGAHIPADGFSRPYVVAMALGTAFYGFAALWISFRIARRYMDERWAFIGTIGVWFASSLPVYMYFNPSWSHAHSAFMVALFLWYWLETRGGRSTAQWMVLGAVGGVMMDVYYINAVLLFLPLAESIASYLSTLKSRDSRAFTRTFAGNIVFGALFFIAFLPTLLTKRIIYGGYLKFGYTEKWIWSSPAFFKVAFSSDHGFLSWTPVLTLAIAGLVLFVRRERNLALGFLGVLLLYTYAIGCYQNWDGLSSFGNRFFVSLTPIFVIGLASCFSALASALELRRAVWAAGLTTAAFVAFNFGLIFQWGTHLIPARGPISWRTAAYNQVVVVPAMAAGMVKNYLTRRSGLMDRIEQEDVRQMKSGGSEETP